MDTAYLNGEYLPLDQARISPLDRGFLFGDGIYEVIPYYKGKSVGLIPHIQRMLDGLASIEIKCDKNLDDWITLLDDLIAKNDGADNNLGVYVHVSRGTDTKRYHAYPENVTPTIFCFTFAIKEPEPVDRSAATSYTVTTSQDLRWKRCHIKSTALLGNVMHFQQGHASGNSECLLYNTNDELTEGSSVNAYIVKDGVIITPIQDNQILPGITRRIIIDSIKADGSIAIEERTVTMEEVRNADEVWISSSSKEIAAIVKIDGVNVGDGTIGPVWEKAMAIYTAAKFTHS
ncbi:MAG: aminotransferase class IV [Pseudomonadales bacterium]|nr:aminotransferase class IV [Pseudomonadales bacterium]NRA17172.1 aminotransferase class IV [Oceanospirillaceae bacterium]